MGEYHALSGLAAHAELHPAGHVLAHIQHQIALRGGEEALRAQALHHAHARALLRVQHFSADTAHDAHAEPCAIVKAGQVPRLFEAGVVGLAVVDLGKQHRAAVRGSPVLVRKDHVARAVLVIHMQFEDEGLAPAVEVAAAAPAQFALVPAGADGGADGVRALTHLRRHVVGLIERAVVVAGPAGGEEVLAHLFAVEAQFVHALGGDIHAGAAHGPGQRELAADDGAGRLGGLKVVFGGDPLGLPVGPVQKGRFKGGLGAGSLAVVEPDLHVHMVERARGKRLARVGEQHRLVRLHAPRVPHKRRHLLVRGHPHAVGLLIYAQRVALRDPADAGRERIQPKGLLSGLNGDLCDLHGKSNSFHLR